MTNIITFKNYLESRESELEYDDYEGQGERDIIAVLTDEGGCLLAVREVNEVPSWWADAHTRREVLYFKQYIDKEDDWQIILVKNVPNEVADWLIEKMKVDQSYDDRCILADELDEFEYKVIAKKESKKKREISDRKRVELEDERRKTIADIEKHLDAKVIKSKSDWYDTDWHQKFIFKPNSIDIPKTGRINNKRDIIKILGEEYYDKIASFFNLGSFSGDIGQTYGYSRISIQYGNIYIDLSGGLNV